MAPKLPDVKTLIQAGINPKTGLPLKMGGTTDALFHSVKTLIQHIDAQDAINRFTWYNLPEGLDSELLERILYTRGQGAFFYMKTLDRFFFLPFALDGEIDVYGRYMGITPVQMGSTNAENAKGKEKPWIQGLSFKPVREVVLPGEKEEKDIINSCVLLTDYSKLLSETVTPRMTLNRELIEAEAECVPFMRTALISKTGARGMRVTSQDEYSNVMAANESIVRAAITGDQMVPIVGGIEFQDLNNTANAADSNQFMLAMQSLDNLRLSTYGLTNGGLFEKQGTILQSEANMADANSGLILQDGLTRRQNFCTIVNSLFGLHIWCEITQPAVLPTTQELGAYSNDQADQQQAGSEAPQGGTENE